MHGEAAPSNTDESCKHPGQGPSGEKDDRLGDTPSATLADMRRPSRPVQTRNEHPGQGLRGEQVHTLVHTPSGTLAGVRTQPNAIASAFSPRTAFPAIDGERRVTDGILARLNSFDGYDAFASQVRGARCCRRPVRLSGIITGIGAEGNREVRFDTRSLPDGVLLKACGTRRETLCPPCASLYRGDAFALVAAGLRGGKGVPEEIGDHPAVLLTLTAPSFGPVHRRRPDGSCHQWGQRCLHGNALVCAVRHQDDDGVIGQALCPDCYDYEGAVLFNAGLSELWRRTTNYAIRSLGSLSGMSARVAARQLRLSYVKVVEFQRRGSVHIHALVRVDVRGDELGDAPRDITADLLATALRIAARKVSAPMAGGGDRRMAWGDQVDAAVISDAENGRRRAASYLAKYAAKGSDNDGVLDRRLRGGVPTDSRLPAHLRSLVQTAWELGDHPELTSLRLHLWAHTCGFRGHFLTKSRRYSTTFASLRDERQQWRLAQRQPAPAVEEPSDIEDEIHEWGFEGSGYLTIGDACLARNLEEQARLGRWLAREDELVEPTDMVAPQFTMMADHNRSLGRKPAGATADEETDHG